jgi:hypothetical protein
MNEMDLLARLRDEVPAGPPSSRAEAALLAAISHEPVQSPETGRRIPQRRAVTGIPRRWPVRPALTGAAGRSRRRRWFPALAGGTAVTLAAVLGVTVAVQPGSPPPGGGYTVAELAAHASTVAAAQPGVPPGQWVFRRFAEGGGPRPVVQYRIWTTADDVTAAYRSGGKTTLIHGPLAGLPEVSHPKAAGTVVVTVTGPPLIRYDQLGSLPTSPTALRDYLLSFPLKGDESRPAKAFDLIEYMLTTYVMPPGLTSELYQVLGHLPTVTVNNHATDIAGRPGVGFDIPTGFPLPHRPHTLSEEIVISATTFRFLGTRTINRPLSGGIQVQGGTAVLQQNLVSGPGILP